MLHKNNPRLPRPAGYMVNKKSPAKDTLDPRSASGKTQALTNRIQQCGFRWVQRNRIGSEGCSLLWETCPGPEHVKNHTSPQQLPAKPQPCLGCWGFQSPPEFCLEAKDSNEAQNSQPNSAPSNHFPLPCLSASLPAFPRGRLTNRFGFSPKIPQPQLILLTEYHTHLSFLGWLGGNSPPPFLPSRPFTSSDLPKALQVNQRKQG